MIFALPVFPLAELVFVVGEHDQTADQQAEHVNQG